LASDNERQIATWRTESLIKSLFLVIGLLPSLEEIKEGNREPSIGKSGLGLGMDSLIMPIKGLSSKQRRYTVKTGK
jgi:hypothetical protein